MSIKPTIRCCFLVSPLKIQPCGYLIKKYIFPVRKNSYDRISKVEPKEQYLGLTLK